MLAVDQSQSYSYVSVRPFVCLSVYFVHPRVQSACRSHQLVELRALAGGSLVLHPCPPCRCHGRGQALAVELDPAEAAAAGSRLKLNLESHLPIQVSNQARMFWFRVIMLSGESILGIRDAVGTFDTSVYNQHTDADGCSGSRWIHIIEISVK